MGWKYTYPHKTVYDSLNERHNLDGNDMVEAINKMAAKGDWRNFSHFCMKKYDETLKGKPWPGNDEYNFPVWLFGNPDNFFKLLEEWLNEKAD